MKSLENILKKLQLGTSEKSWTRPGRDKNKASIQFIEMIQNWEKIVGKNFAKHTLPLKIQDSCLIILSSHPALSEQLKSMQLNIKKKIDKAYPSLRSDFYKIGFKTNPEIFKKKKIKTPLSSCDQKQKLHPHSPEYKKISNQAKVLFEDIQDQELKESLTTIYIQSLEN